MKIKDIKNKTDDYYGFDISGECRTDEFKEARQFYYAFARMNNYKLHVIGNFVNRGHDTVIHGIKRFKENMFYTSYSEKYSKYLMYMYNVTLFTKVEFIEVEASELPEPILNVCNELKKLNDSDILEFTETRLQPFILSIKSRKYNDVENKNIVGASLERKHVNPFLS